MSRLSENSQAQWRERDLLDRLDPGPANRSTDVAAWSWQPPRCLVGQSLPPFSVRGHGPHRGHPPKIAVAASGDATGRRSLAVDHPRRRCTLPRRALSPALHAQVRAKPPLPTASLCELRSQLLEAGRRSWILQIFGRSRATQNELSLLTKDCGQVAGDFGQRAHQPGCLRITRREPDRHHVRHRALGNSWLILLAADAVNRGGHRCFRTSTTPPASASNAETQRWSNYYCPPS